MSDFEEKVAASNFKTLRLNRNGKVLFVSIDAPPMNLLGPALVTDLVSLIDLLEHDESCAVVVFTSANDDFFIPHVDVLKIKEYRQAAARLSGVPSIGLLFRQLSLLNVVTIAQIEGQVGGAGSEFVLACDMRFASTDARFLQMECAFGNIPGAGALQHLTRLLGRARALEVLLSADDFTAAQAAEYGWVNRTMGADELKSHVATLAHRISRFPAEGIATVKRRVNDIALPPMEAIRKDSDLFGEASQTEAAKLRIAHAVELGFQVSQATELGLGAMLGRLDDSE
jgi:enoyl-CoA hydratase/carnithine racemase